MTTGPSRLRHIRADAAVCVVAVVARLASLWYFGMPGRTYYLQLSDSVLRLHTFGYDGVPTTWIEPLYPASLALARWVTGDRMVLVLILQILLASAGAVALRRLTVALSGDARAGVIAALLYALHPYLARQAVAYQDLTLTTVLLILCALQFARLGRPRAALWLGLSFGLLLLTRLSLAPLLAVVVILLAAERRFRVAAAVCLVVLAVLLPWAVRNYRIDGTLGGSRAGENLFVSTSEHSRQLLPGYDVDLYVGYAYDLIDPELANVPPERLDAEGGRLLMIRALRYAKAHPLDVLYVKARSALYVFAPRLVPYYAKDPDTRLIVDGASFRIEGLVRRPWIEEVTYSAAATAILALAAVGLSIRRRMLWTDRFLLATVAVFTVMHAVFFPTTRLVSPMFFVLMFYAGIGGSAFWIRLKPHATAPSAAVPPRP